MEKHVVSGVLLHPYELTEKWILRAHKAGINRIGIHPAGGIRAPQTLENLLERLQTPEFRALIDMAVDLGMEIEYEMHAASWLLPREYFDTHPEYFRMDENGERTAKRNFCVSNAEAMKIVTDRALFLAKSLYKSRPVFYFWLDDVRNERCHCEKCKDYSISDQQMIFLNAVIEKIRTEIPNAKIAYLAYFGTMEPPKYIMPNDGIFLEYAPIDKCSSRRDPSLLENAKKERELLFPLIKYFGEDRKILEYWLDNSLFSNWTKPPKELKTDANEIFADVKDYVSLGFYDIATFACYLGDDYEELYGEPDITDFVNAFKNL